MKLLLLILILFVSQILLKAQELNVIIEKVDVSCYGDHDGSATAIVSGGTEPYTFEWNTGSFEQEITNLVEGNYSVTIVDNLAATVSATVHISEPDALRIDNILYNSTSCYGSDDGFAQVFVSGGNAPYSYSWSNGENASTINCVAGTYSITVQDIYGCNIIDEVTISEPAPIYVATTNDTTICSGTCALIGIDSISGGRIPYTGVWDYMGMGSSFLVSPAETTTYTGTVYDFYGCASPQFSIVVSVSDTFESTEQISICEGDSIFWHGSWFSSDVGLNEFDIQYQSIYGCDSIYRLILSTFPIPLQFTVGQSPSNGILEQDVLGNISLSSSESDVLYYITLSGQVIAEEIEGDGGEILFGNEFPAGTYEIMSKKIDSNCELTQGTVTFSNSNVNTLNSVKKYEFYPNPATDIITFKDIPNHTKFEIFDVKGNSIQKGSIIDNKIIVKNYKSGSYIIVITDNENKVGIKKFIIK